MEEFESKKSAILEQMKEWTKREVCVAFSGGVDSSLLLYLAAKAAEEHKSQVYAVTFVTSLHPQKDLAVASKVAVDMGVKHVIIEVNEFEDERICQNPKERCYLCKKLLFTKLWEFAREKGVSVIMEGTNHDDLSVYRPGLQAVRELGVISPLAGAGLIKQEVRRWAKECGISVATRPAAPCLATRLPYGTRLDRELLMRIDGGEEFLKSLGFETVRIRQHGDITRIEVMEAEVFKVLNCREKILTELKKIGFRYITLDLEGFRSGSMDEYLEETKK